MGGKKFTITAIGTFLVLIFSYVFLLSQFSWKNSTPTHAVVKTWSGGATGVWENGANWSPAGVPTNADDVTIDNATVTLSSGQTADFNSLTIGAGSPTIFILEGNINTGGNLTISNGSSLQQNNLSQQILTGDFIVQSGGFLTHDYNTAAQLFAVNFKAQNITVDAGGTVRADGTGYQGASGANSPGNGPGAGSSATGGGNGPGGGGHGGAGGDGFGGALGGPAYCTISNITTIGSSGGAGDDLGGGSFGGPGGGLIKLEAINTLTINGDITANGSGVPAGVNGGSGAGGGIKLKGSTIAGSPFSLSASGGNIEDLGGSGAGGCVRVEYVSSTSINLGNITVDPGNESGTGSSGAQGIKSVFQILPPPVATPTSPLSINNIQSHSVNFSWTSGGGSETFFILEASTNTLDYYFVATTSVATSSYSFSGLTPNTQYTFRVAAGDGSATSTFISSTPTYTLAALVNYVGVTNPSTSTLDISWTTIISNPTSTEYAIFNPDNGTYLTSAGFETSSPIFFTSSSWNGAARGLISNTTYQFVMIPRNGSGVTSVTSSLSTPTTTLTNTPATPIVSSTTSTSQLSVSFASDNNSPSTTYALFATQLNAYITATGTTSTIAVFFTTSTWGGVVTGLSANTAYQFSATTPSTTTSSPSTNVFTSASVPFGVVATANNSQQITVSWNGDATNYYVENVTVGTNSGWTSSTSTVFTGLSCNTAYDFKVKGRNGNLVETNFSSTVSASTLSCPTSGASGGGLHVNFLVPPALPSTSFNTSSLLSSTASPNSPSFPSELPSSPASPILNPPNVSTPPPSPTSSRDRFEFKDLTFLAPRSVVLSPQGGVVSELSCVTTTIQISLNNLPLQPQVLRATVASSSPSVLSTLNDPPLVASEVSEKKTEPPTPSAPENFRCSPPARSFNFLYNRLQQNYSNALSMPVGTYSLSVTADYSERRDEVVASTIKVVPLGIISPDSSNIYIPQARISLYTLGGTLASAAPSNPQTTNLGSYGFVVSSSTQPWYLEIITSEGRVFRTTPFTAPDGIVNRKIILSAKRTQPLPVISSSSISSSRAISSSNKHSSLPNMVKSITGLLAALALGGFLAQIPLSTLGNLLRLLFLQPVRGRRKEASFGIVYNSLNKQPVPLALVRLFDLKQNRLIQSRATDEKGRFFFHAAPGNYRIEVSKSGFFFPSTILKDFHSDGKHDPLYHGEKISVTDKNPLLSVHIPLDPPGITKTPSRLYREKIFRSLQLGISIFGIMAGIFLLAWQPHDSLQWIVLALNIALFILFWFLAMPKKPKSWGIAYETSSKHPINRAVARLFNTEFNKLVDSQITDTKGRYFFFAGGSNFKVTVEHPEFETTTSEEIKLKDKEQATISSKVALKKKK